MSFERQRVTTVAKHSYIIYGQRGLRCAERGSRRRRRHRFPACQWSQAHPCAPNHPSSNGLVDCFIRTFKQALKAGKDDGRSLEQRLEKFLLTYRTSPHATTGVVPCTLFLQQSLRTRLDLLKSDIGAQVRDKQAKQIDHYNQHSKERVFVTEQKVMVRNFRPGLAWFPGTILRKLGPVSFLAEVENGLCWRRHVHHLRARKKQSPATQTNTHNDANSEDSEPAIPVVYYPSYQ